MGGVVAAARAGVAPGSATAHETHRAEKAAVNDMPTPVEPDTPENAQDGLYKLHEEHQDEGEVNQGKNDHDRVRDPLCGA